MSVRARPVVRTRPPRRVQRARAAAPPAGQPIISIRPRPETLPRWVKFQGANVTRHAAALRPFRREEFGVDAAAPTIGHIQAANALLGDLRRELMRVTGQVRQAARAAAADPSRENLDRMLRLKEHAHSWVRSTEQIWDFYFELFGQRQSQPYGDWLLSCDRIALDCYQAAYLGVNVPKSVPAPPPFAYMRTGFSPATFRRGIPLARLGRRSNPFPLVQLPYHRLVNPWTLGAILHEVSHNLQNDLGMARVIPATIRRELTRQGLGELVATTWTRWNREIFADLSGLLLGGPSVVGSLMDVVGRGPETTRTFSPRGPHPTPYLRTFISIELLRRMGFPREAGAYERAWRAAYPAAPRGSRARVVGTIPRPILDTFEQANRTVVDIICYRRYPQLGNRALSRVISFAPKEQQMVEEAARRLAAGTDPGVIPARFLIGASRVALDRRLARPQTIADNFYKELARR
jgi:hypothetical protein